MDRLILIALILCGFVFFGARAMAQLDAGHSDSSVRTTSTSTHVIFDPNKLEDPTQANALLTLLVAAFKKRSWMLVFGLLLTLFVAAIKMFKPSINPDFVPWLTLAIATLGSVAVGLQAGKDAFAIVVTALGVGWAAIGGYETFGKMIQKVIAKKKEVTVETVVVAPDPPAPPPSGR